MTGVKNIFRKLHLFFGLFTGLVVFIVATTGAMYAFEEEFRGLTYSDLLHVKQGKSKKSLDELAHIVKTQYPQPPIKNIRFNIDATSSVEFVLKNKESIFLNPYTGKIIGTANRDTDFFGTVLKIHRSLYLDDVGKIITGTSATIFLFMIISGIVIWWPRNKKSRKRKFSIVKNAAGKRLTYDLHSVLGFYASWILLFIALTGIIWSFKWAENTLYWICASKKEDTKKLKSVYTTNATGFSLDKTYYAAKELSPDTKDCFISLPDDSTGTIRVTLQYDNSGFFRKTDQVFFDQYSGNLIKPFLFKSASAGDRLKSANYNIHTGKALGFVGQCVVFFAAIIAASLPVTGFLMWRRKRRRAPSKVQAV